MAKKSPEDQNEIPFLEKFMVSQTYDIFRFGGEEIKNDEVGIQRMLQNFSGLLTEEQIRENMKKYNLPKIVAMFKWSKEFDNLDIYGDCFRYTLFLMNDVCIFGEMQALDANNALLHLLNGDMQIMKLAEDCYWTIVVFSMAHEIAHAYLAHIGKKYSERHPEKEEYDADAIAYDIVLKIIMKESNEEPILEKYTYLAPAMYMDFFDLYYYTDRVLYKTMLSDSEHPNPVKRKGKLFAIVDKDEYDFDTIDGNHLYGGFLDVYDEYRDQVFLKKEKGKLDKIIHTERRNRMRR